MVKPLARGLALLALTSLLLLGAGGFWLQQDVRTLNWAKPRLEAALNPPGAPYKIRIGDVVLDWRDLSRFGRIRVNGMVVTLLDGTAFAAVPQVEVSVDPLGFLPGHSALHGIILVAPKLYLTRTAEGAIRMGLEEQGQSLPLNELIGFFTAKKDTLNKAPSLPFRAIAVEGASMTLKDEVSGGASLLSSPFTLRLAKSAINDLTGLLAMPFTYNGTKGRIDARLSGSFTSTDHIVNASLSKFPVELACQFGACPPDISGSGFISGKANVLLDANHKIVGGNAALRARKATFTAPKLFAEPLKFKDGTVSVHLGERGRNLLIESAKFAFDDITLALRLQLIAKGDKWRLIMQGKSGRLDVDKLYKYWPLVLAPGSRDWVTSKLKSGYAASGSVALNITSAMYDANTFPAEAVHATVDARDITVEYLPGFPEVRHVNGVARFVGDTMRVDATAGTTLSGTKIVAAVLTADDLHHPNAPMVARMRLNAPAADVVKFLSLEHFVFDDGWKLDAGSIKGGGDIGMRLGFDSFSEGSAGLNFDKVTYDVTANLKNIAQPNLFGNMNVRDLTGTLHTSNTALSFSGRLGLGAATGVNIALAQDAKGGVSADVSGSLPRSEFTALGIPDKPWFGQGTLGLNAHLDLGKDTIRPTRANLDLTDLAMDIPELSWKKVRGEKGVISIAARAEEHSYAVSLAARDFEVKDAVITTDAEGNLTAVSLPRVKNARNDFALDYKTTADGYTVNLSGPRLDASASYGQSENSLLADFPPITLNVDLGEMVLVPSAPLHDLKGNLTCNKQRCSSMRMTAKTGEGKLEAIIGVPATKSAKAAKREFLLTASNAGELLRALDITDRLYNGQLELSGKYDDAKQPAPFNGRLVITDFSLKNSQILGRIVSLASITGVGDALTGTMNFEKLGAGIGHANGIVNVTNGRASGASIGITLEGKVDTTTTRLNIKGVLVPANLINSLFTKIPIIGWVAGKEGEGLIAFNYKIDGSYSDPEISVNPFSGLTPGVLRGVFGGDAVSGKNKGEAAPYPGDRPAPGVAPVKKIPKTAPANKPTTN